MFEAAAAPNLMQIPVGSPANMDMRVPNVNRSKTKRDIQSRQRAWLKELCEATGLKPSQLATGASVSESTLTRLLNNKDYTGTLGPETIERLRATYRVPGPDGVSAGKRVGGVILGLQEAARFDARSEMPEIARVIDAIIADRHDMQAWRLKTMALESAGYLPGDFVFVQELEEGVAPRPQDAVCAAVADYQHGSAETIWRIFDPPFLVAAAHDRTAYKPLLVDNERVRILGIIRQSYRPHPLSATR